MIIGVGNAADRQQQVRPDHLRRAAFAIDLNCYFIPLFFDADTFRIEADGDPFVFQDFPDRFGDVFIVALNQARPLLDHCYFAAKAGIHLGEFESDVTAADDSQMLRQKVDVHHAGVGQIIDLIEAGEVWHPRPPADVDEDFLRSRISSPTRTVCGASKRACPL